MHVSDGNPKPTTTLTGTVEKIIKPRFEGEAEKAEIVIDNGEPFYREIRIENTLKDAGGKEVALKKDAPVEITVAAEPADTTSK